MEEFKWEDIENLVVEEFEERHAESLAQMWRESDADWPGSFTAGTELTGKKLLEDLKNIRTACRYILRDKKKDLVAGVLECMEIPGNKDAVYAGLNLHPAYRGGAAIVVANIWTKTVDKLVELGYRYLEMETWPGNSRMIVIGKQSGFYWVPGTAVRMENYFPLLMQNPLILKFFTKHDIVECQYEMFMKTNIELKEDKITWKGMQVYPYEWKRGKDSIKAIVDPASRGITAIENQDLSISCYPGEKEAFAGGKTEVFWEIINKKEEPLPISFLIETDEGLEIEKTEHYQVNEKETMTEKMASNLKTRAAHSYLVEDKIIIKEKVILSGDLEEREKKRPAYKVWTKAFAGGELLKLETGIKVKQLIELSWKPEYLSLKPEQENLLTINVKNNYPQELDGFIYLSSSSPLLEVNQRKIKFKLAGGELTGLPLKVKAREEGVFYLQMFALCQKKDVRGQKSACPASRSEAGEVSLPRFAERGRGSQKLEEEIKTKTKSLSLRCLKDNGLGGSIDEEELVLENEQLLLRVNLKNGKLNLYDKFIETDYLTQSNEELGPPFMIYGGDPAFFGERQFKGELKEEEGKIVGIIKTLSSTHPNLTIEKEITLTNSSLIKIQYKFNNTSKDSYSFHLQVRTNCLRSDSFLTLPLSEGIVSSPIIAKEFPSPGNDLSSNPADYGESWSAFEIPPLVTGLIWSKALKCEYGLYKMPDLTFPVPQIKGLASCTLSPFYIYAGFGNWETVRYYYQKIIKGDTSSEHKEIKPGKILSLSTNPYPLISPAEEIKFEVVLKNLRNKSLSGTLQIRAPQGFEVKENEFILENVNRSHPFSQKIEILRKKGAGVYYLQADLKTELFGKEFQLPLICSGDSSSGVKREKKTREGKEVITIDNGNLVMEVCPEFCGSLFSLKKEGVEHLSSSFPEPAELSWFSPWYGGIYPLCMKELSLPGKMFEEKYGFELTSRQDNYGSEWSGVKIKTQLQSPEFKGINLEVEYLTQPLSNLLAILSRLENTTTYFFEFFSALGIFLQMGGTQENSILHFEKDEARQRKRTIYDAWVGAGRWAAVENPQSSDWGVALAASEYCRVIAADLGIMGPHFFSGSQIKLKPKETKEYLNYFLLTDGLKKAKDYQVLAEAGNIFELK